MKSHFAFDMELLLQQSKYIIQPFYDVTNASIH